MPKLRPILVGLELALRVLAGGDPRQWRWSWERAEYPLATRPFDPGTRYHLYPPTFPTETPSSGLQWESSPDAVGQLQVRRTRCRPVLRVR